MNDQEVAALVALVGMSWKSFQGGGPTCEAWLRQLADLDPDSVLAAVDALHSEGREFAPNAGQIRRKAIELSHPAIPTPDEAWGEVRAAFSSVGRRGKPAWSHPAIATTVQHLGWGSLCSGDEEMGRSHFLRLYAACAERETRIAALPPSVIRFAAEIAARNPVAGIAAATPQLTTSEVV